MRFALPAFLLFSLTWIEPVSAQHAIVSTVIGGSTPLGVIDTATPQSGRFISTGQASLSSVVVTPDGTHAYVGSDNQDITYFDLASGLPVAEIPIFGVFLPSLAIHPNGRRLYVAYLTNGNGLNVATIDTATNQIVNTVSANAVGSISFNSYFGFSPDREEVFVGSSGSLVLTLDASTGALKKTTTLAFGLNGFASSGDGSVLAATGTIGLQGVVVLLDPQTLMQKSQIALPGQSCASAVAVDGAGAFAYVVYSANCTGFIPSGSTTQVGKIDLATQQVVGSVPTRTTAEQLLIPDNQTTLYVGESGSVGAISLNTFTTVASYSQPGHVTALAAGKGGQFIYAGNSTDSVAGYVNEGAVEFQSSLTVGPTSYRANQSSMATTFDGIYTFVPSRNAAGVAVVDNRVQKVVRYLAAPVEPTLVAVGSSAGPLYAVSLGLFAPFPSKLSAVDPHTGKLLRAVALLNYGQSVVAVSPDDSQVWIASKNDNQVSVYDAGTFAMLGTLSVNGPQGVAFSPDSAHCYVTSYELEGGVLDIDTKTLATLRVIAPSLEIPATVNVSPDSQLLYVVADTSMYTIRVSDGAILGSTPAGQKPTFTAMSTDGREIYIADKLNLRMFDTASGVVSLSTTLGSSISGLSFTPY